MQKELERILLSLHKKYGLKPNFLTYSRIFAAPWLALWVAEIIQNENLGSAIILIVIYLIVVSTDYLDGILARLLAKENAHDLHQGGMLDRLSDKILIIFMLVPFGLNLLTLCIILAESFLAYQALTAKAEKKQATYIGKIKMVLQTFLIPVLLLAASSSWLPQVFYFGYLILTIIFSFLSVYSHFPRHEEAR